MFDAFKEKIPATDQIPEIWARIAVLDNAVSGAFNQAFGTIISSEQLEASRNAANSEVVNTINTNSTYTPMAMPEKINPAPVVPENLTQEFVPASLTDEQAHVANLEAIRLSVETARVNNQGQN